MNPKTVLFFALSFKDTLSAKITPMMFMIPAELVPCKARPNSSIPQVCAAAQRVLPINIRDIASWSTTCRPKTSASWPKAGINAVDVRVKEVAIQLSSSNLSSHR